MTNKKFDGTTAISRLKAWIHWKKLDLLKNQDADELLFVQDIERALDEAEQRGDDKSRPFYEKEIASVATREYERGQREMRERAEKVVTDFYGICGTSETIRTLPIEGK